MQPCSLADDDGPSQGDAGILAEAAAVGSNSCYCLPLTVVDFSEPVSYAGLCAITARYLFFLSALLADLSAAIYDLVEFLRGGDMEHLGCSSGSICLSFWG